MGGRKFLGPGVGFGVGAGCGFGVGWGLGGGPIGFMGLGAGGGCGVGAGLGWGFGAAYGANYLRIAPSFAQSTSSPRRSNPLQALQQQFLRLLGRGESSGPGGRAGAKHGSSISVSKLADKQ